MGLPSSSLDTNWFMFRTPTIPLNNLLLVILLALFSISFLKWTIPKGGIAWRNKRNQMGQIHIQGPKGLPIFGILFALNHDLPHRTLASIASALSSTKQLMAFSLGSTPAVITSNPSIAREILNSPHFSNRPIKQSAKSLMFSRAIGFAPNGTYWRSLRRVASTHLFSPRRIIAHEAGRRLDCTVMLDSIAYEQSKHGFVCLRKHLQDAALNNVMGTVFGSRLHNRELCHVKELHEMVKEGFELLGAFNWSDYVSWISFFYDPYHIRERCLVLAPRVKKFVKMILDEHRMASSSKMISDDSDFVDVLLSLEGDEKLQDDDIIAILWEMIFRGTDTTALLTEWIMAELILNQQIQTKLLEELNNVIGNKNNVTDADVTKMPYLEAIVKETLHMTNPIDLSEVLKLSCEMKNPLKGVAIPRLV
ncbi:hypothetical protein P8452_04565 [Trifolium repens]|nr:hypothetical protein P8452_04565 [Trifolium repens]